MKSRATLTVVFVLLVAVDLWGVAEIVRFLAAYGHSGDFAVWFLTAVVAMFYAGLIWITVRVGKRLGLRRAGPQ